MNGEQKFLLGFWLVVSIFLGSVITVSSHYGDIGDQRIVEMVEQGADPLEARCAVRFTNSCDLVILSKQKGE